MTHLPYPIQALSQDLPVVLQREARRDEAIRAVLTTSIDAVLAVLSRGAHGVLCGGWPGVLPMLDLPSPLSLDD